MATMEAHGCIDDQLVQSKERRAHIKEGVWSFIDLERQFAGMMQNPDIIQGRRNIWFANMRGVMKQIDLGPSMEDLHYDWLMTFMLNLNLIDEDPCPLLVIDGTRNHGAYFPRLTPISEA